MAKNMKMVTAEAPVNIAVIKYWGKTDEELILPLNDSISGTLSTDDLRAMTTVAASDEFTCDRMWLNGEEVDFNNNKRLVNCLSHIKKKSPVAWSGWHVHISSKNNFPTAAGLASSAAGYACLVYALGHLFGIEDATELSTLARLGSGSACRSLFGGFVRWVTGTDSSTSIARQIVPAEHWPQMRVLILVVSDHQKDTSSTSGMQQSVKTSSFLKFRVENLEDRVNEMTEAIVERNFAAFAELTMRDSNSLHAVCQDTWPPIRYMNDISWSIVSLIHKYNDFYGTTRVAYTFDAGPNACLYLYEEFVPEVYNLIKMFYPPKQSCQNFLRGLEVESVELPKKLLDAIGNKHIVRQESLQYIISTKIGDGPRIVKDKQFLDSHGNPI